LLSVCIAVPLGIISATRQYSVYDYAVTIIALIGISLPSFFMALGLVKIISMDLALLPISGMEDYLQGYTGMARFVDIIRHMALPVIVLTLAQTASTMRYTRSAMLEVIQQDYIRTARAKGLKEKVVIYTHAFRNAMIPVVTIVSTSLGFIFSGAILIEMVFAWPGMGTLMYQAISNRDYPVVMGCTMILGVFVLMANTLADILYAVVDPRIRFS
jgi:ABC-type dipeptide/oligopeptide/nickel transport systems, permease components